MGTAPRAHASNMTGTQQDALRRRISDVLLGVPGSTG
jgi:hypothetical protein